MNPGIYHITNTTNGKRYVGSSANVTNRLSVHRYELRRGVHDNSHLQKAFDKYGESSFTFELVESCDVADLLVVEQRHIDATESYKRDHGYNLRRDATGARHTAESRAKMSLVQRGLKKPASVGIFRSERNKQEQSHLRLQEHLRSKGLVSPNQKLTPVDVEDIKFMVKQFKVSAACLADVFKVNASTITRALRGTTQHARAA